MHQANELSGFKKSSNRQLIPIADLDMFNAWRKLWNNRDLPPEDRKKMENMLSERGSRLEQMLRAPEEY